MAKKNEWDQRPNESSKAYAAFEVYRDMGAERSTAAVSQKLGKAKALIQRWSATHGWVDRCRLFDERVSKIRSEAEESHLRESYIDRLSKHLERTEQVANALSAVGLKALGICSKVIDKTPDGEVPPPGLATLMRATASVLDAANISRGEALGLDELMDKLDEASE